MRIFADHNEDLNASTSWHSRKNFSGIPGLYTQKASLAYEYGDGQKSYTFF